MTKNRLHDLNDHLFAQIERLSDEALTSAEIDLEYKRAEAMVGVSDQILKLAAVQIKAAELVSEFDGADPKPYLTMMETKDVKDARSALTLVARK